MTYTLQVVGMCLLMFAIVVYITSFKEINKYFVWQWKAMIENGRDIVYLETHPKGPYAIPGSNDNNFHYKQMVKQHGKFIKNFHRRILNPNKLVKE